MGDNFTDEAESFSEELQDLLKLKLASTKKRWLEKGTTDLNMLAKETGKSRSSARILALEDGDVLSSDTNRMVELASNFYKDLYSNSEVDDEEGNQLVSLLNSLDGSEAEFLNKSFSPKEILLGIRLMKGGKSPGEDGLIAEFYKEFEKQMSIMLCDLFNEIFSRPWDLSAFAKGIVILLFKKGDPSKLGNYRPLTLLNVDYKILMKVISL